MIALSNTNAQVLSPGQSVTFNQVVLHTGCAECYRPNTGVVNLSAKTAIYEVNFHGNIGADTEGGVAQLAITLDGSALQETTTLSTTAAAGDLNNIAIGTFVKTCCCNASNSIMVTNTGATTVNIGDNLLLRIKRVA